MREAPWFAPQLPHLVELFCCFFVVLLLIVCCLLCLCVLLMLKRIIIDAGLFCICAVYVFVVAPPRRVGQRVRALELAAELLEEVQIPRGVARLRKR